MKRIIVFSFLFLAMLLFCIPASAREAKPYGDGAFTQDSAEDILRDMPISLRQGIDAEDFLQTTGVFRSFIQLFQNILTSYKDLFRDPLNLFTRIMAVALLSLLFGASKDSDGTSARPMHFAINAVVGLTVGAIASETVMGLIGSADKTITVASGAVKSLVPVYSGVMVATGNVTSAALYGFAATASASAAAFVMQDIVRPLAGVLLGLGLVSGLCENNLYTFAEGIRRLLVRGMGVLSTGFVSLLSLQTFIGGSADSLILKAARFIVTGSVPIVGQAVSQAASTLLGSLHIIKGTVGIAGILLISALVLPYILASMLSSLALGMCAVCCDVLMLKDLTKSLRILRSAVDILTATLSFYAVVLIVCTAILIRAGGV